MFPTLLRIGGFELATYGVLVASGAALGIQWLKSQRKEMGLTEDEFWDLIYALFAGTIVGAKLAYVIVERDVTLLWRQPRYGFVFYGGFIGAALFGWFVTRRWKFSFWRLADYFSVALPMIHAVGRLGCFFAGCCYGRHTDLPWGVPMAGDPSRHPTQLYEAAANAVIAVLVARVGLPRVKDGRWRRGSAFFLYIGGYAVVRFLIEFVRGDDRGRFIAGLSPSQLIALGVLALCASPLRPTAKG